MSTKTKIIIGVVVVAGIAAAYYYFKVYKPKQVVVAPTKVVALDVPAGSLIKTAA